MKLFRKIRRAPMPCQKCGRILEKLKGHKFEFNIYVCKPCQKYWVVQESGKVAEIILAEQLDDVIRQAKEIVEEKPDAN